MNSSVFTVDSALMIVLCAKEAKVVVKPVCKRDTPVDA